MIDSLSIAFNIFARCMLTSLSVDEILLLRDGNQSTIFRGLPFKVKIRKNVVLSYTCSCRIHTDAMNNRRRKTSL